MFAQSPTTAAPPPARRQDAPQETPRAAESGPAKADEPKDGAFASLLNASADGETADQAAPPVNRISAGLTEIAGTEPETLPAALAPSFSPPPEASVAQEIPRAATATTPEGNAAAIAGAASALQATRSSPDASGPGGAGGGDAPARGAETGPKKGEASAPVFSAPTTQAASRESPPPMPGAGRDAPPSTGGPPPQSAPQPPQYARRDADPDLRTGAPPDQGARSAANAAVGIRDGGAPGASSASAFQPPPANAAEMQISALFPDAARSAAKTRDVLPDDVQSPRAAPSETRPAPVNPGAPASPVAPASQLAGVADQLTAFPSGEGNFSAPTGPATGGSPTAAELRAAGPAGQTAPPPAPRETPAPAAQLALAISRAGGNTVDIRLDPPELGRVTMSLQLGDDRLVAVIAAERGETLDLMRRNGEDLQRALRENGFENVSLDFSKRREGDGAGSGAAMRQETDAPPDAPPPKPDRHWASGGGVDIRL